MRFYHVSAAIDGAPYTATLEEAKRIARNAAANSYHDVVVELVEVATDKENILRLLNNAAGTHIDGGLGPANSSKSGYSPSPGKGCTMKPSRFTDRLKRPRIDCLPGPSSIRLSSA